MNKQIVGCQTVRRFKYIHFIERKWSMVNQKQLLWCKKTAHSSFTNSYLRKSDRQAGSTRCKNYYGFLNREMLPYDPLSHD